jgi:hypothetical protein
MAIVFGPTQWQNQAYQSILVQEASLGDSVGGGYLICRNGGVAWIVAPNTTEVSRNWSGNNDAITTANANASCGDWFIPTSSQLVNPGRSCKTYWDYSSAFYWSSTEDSGIFATIIGLSDNRSYSTHKTSIWCVRAFRCVSY